jgi:hypothetical protein
MEAFILLSFNLNLQQYLYLLITNKSTIKTAALSDIESLQTVSIQTFKKKFPAFNTSKNRSNYISQSFRIKQPTEELTNPEYSFYLAILEDITIG